MLMLFGGKGAEPGPADFGDLVAWFDPRYAITHSGDGSDVTAWTDVTGAHVGSVLSAPTWRASDWNGRPVVEFDGSVDAVAFDSVAPFFSGTDVPLYVVMAFQALSVATGQVFWGLGHSSIAATSRRFDLGTSTSERYICTKRDDALTIVQLVSTVDFLKSNRALLTYAQNGTQIRLLRDGTVDPSLNGAAMDVGATTLDRFTLGCMRGSNTTSFGHFRMGPMLVYASLSDAFAAERWLVQQGYGPPSYAQLESLFADDASWTGPITGEATVECWGAGGGGTTDTGGGGGGAYSRSFVQLVAGTDYGIVVGTGAADTDGEDSTFEASVVVAKGGLSGTNGGTGGATGTGTGDVKFAGGNGGVGTGSRAGGGAAGDLAAGANATGGQSNGGVATSALAGSAFGVGGGSTAAAGLAGQRGEVRITLPVWPTQAFPVVRGRAWMRDSSAATSRNATLPARIEAGERLLLVVFADGDPTITVSGWTKVGQHTETSGNQCTLAAFEKVAAGADSAAIVTSTSVLTSHHAWRIQNGGAATWTVTNGQSAAPDSPSHSIGSSAKSLWIAAFVADANGAPGLTGAPTDYGAVLTMPQRSAAGVLGATAERLLEASSENPGAWSMTASEQWVAATISVPYEASPPPALTALVIDTFFANGTWISPPHAGTAVVRGWGGGSGNVIDTNAGGGGAYAQLNAWAFAPSANYAVTVGTGGNGAGGNTTLDTSALVAEGGQTNGTGGKAANSTGDVKYDGGDGVVGAGNVNAGGGAGEQEAGHDGSEAGVLSGAPGQVSGGRGGSAAVNGLLIGGGAGSHATAQRGGARGELRIEYYTPATPEYPRLRGYAVGRDTAAATSRPAVMPGNIIPGELLLCLVAIDSTSGGASMAGWTELFEVTEAGNQITTAAYYKFAAGGDSGTIATVSSRFTSHVTLRIANAATPVAATASGSSANADSPNLDATTTAKRLWISFVGWDMNAPSATALTAVPTGFGNVITVGTHTNGAPLLALAMRYEEAQQVDPGAWTSATEQWVAATIGIGFWTF